MEQTTGTMGKRVGVGCGVTAVAMALSGGAMFVAVVARSFLARQDDIAFARQSAMFLLVLVVSTEVVVGALTVVWPRVGLATMGVVLLGVMALAAATGFGL